MNQPLQSRNMEDATFSKLSCFLKAADIEVMLCNITVNVHLV